MKKDKPDKEKKSWLRNVLAVLFLALIAFTGVDGYFNSWGTAKRIWFWKTLEFHSRTGQSWTLRAKKDFEFIEISDVQTVVHVENLLAFDQPYRDSGYFRIYFRLSDTASTQLQKMYGTIRLLDTADYFSKSIQDSKRAYATLQTLLGKPSSPLADSLVVQKRDTVHRSIQGNLTMGSDDDISSAIKKLLGSPQVIAGVGLGAALSVGVDFLRGKAFCAFVRENSFRIDSIQAGIRAGRWEGAPIDILWVFHATKPTDSLHTPSR